MPTKDPDKARSRFINATNRFLAGARLQRERVMRGAADAPRLLEGTPEEAVDLTSVPSNDLDYYVYELARLRAVADEVNKAFDDPQEISDAVAVFEAEIPELRNIRNPLTHASDDERLDDVAWFSAVVRLGSTSPGSVEYLVDPRYRHHEATEAFASAILSYLRAGLRGS